MKYLRIGLRLLSALCLGCAGSSSNSDGSDGSSSSSTDTGEDTAVEGIGICGHLIECARSSTPSGLTTLIATYGEAGSCWDLPGVTKEDCYTECKGILDSMRASNPTDPACWECDAAEDCRFLGMPYCNLGDCASTTCGNGIIDGVETCEISVNDHCDTDCLDHCSECHPLNKNNTCGDGSYCTIFPNRYDPITNAGVCSPTGTGVAGSICSPDVPCAEGYFCATPNSVEGCTASGTLEGCCTQFCDVNNNDCPNNLPCTGVFWYGEVTICSGLGNVGYCGYAEL